MGHHCGWYGEPATDCTTALPKTYRCFTIRTAAIIVISAASATTARSTTILVPAALAGIALQSCLYRDGIVLGELNDGVVTLVIILCQRTHQHSAYLYRDTWIPLLWRGRLFFQMRIPHLLNKCVGKRRATSQQFINTDGECVLVGVAPWIALPLFRRHIRSSAGDFTQRCVRLHPKIERRAEICEQDLSITSNQQVAGLDVLVNKAVLVNVVKRCCCLLNIWHKLFCVYKSPAAIFFAKEVMNSFRRILHDQVGAFILYLTKVINREDIGVLQVSNALRLVKKAVSSLFVELVCAQYL